MLKMGYMGQVLEPGVICDFILVFQGFDSTLSVKIEFKGCAMKSQGSAGSENSAFLKQFSSLANLSVFEHNLWYVNYELLLTFSSINSTQNS